MVGAERCVGRRDTSHAFKRCHPAFVPCLCADAQLCASDGFGNCKETVYDVAIPSMLCKVGASGNSV